MVGHLNNPQMWNLCLQSVFLLVVGWNTLSWGPQVTQRGANFLRPDSNAGSEEIRNTLRVPICGLQSE